MCNTKILVLLVNYNGASLTDVCIESINNSSEQVDIIVIDNASSENDIEAVCEKYPNVILKKLAENIGFSGANNIGIAYAVENHYKYIMLLNNDTVIDRDTISELLKNCNENQVSVPCIYYFDNPETVWYAGGEIDRKKGVVYHHRQNEKCTDMKDRFCDFATGCCLMMMTETAEKVGNLRDDYFMYCEDLDYSIRLRKNGVKIRFVPLAKLWHKVGSTSGNELSPICAYYGSRNRLDVIDRYPEVFNRSAKLYTYLTRVIKCIICLAKGIPSGKMYIWAIKDYRKGVTGKVKLEI